MFSVFPFPRFWREEDQKYMRLTVIAKEEQVSAFSAIYFWTLSRD